jgi:hypothetical protein
VSAGTVVGAGPPDPARSRPTLEDTITARALAAIPGILLALALSACSSSGDGGSAEASRSPRVEATGHDYAALLTALFDQQGRVKTPTTATEFNEQADFPEGVSIGEFDQGTSSLCIQDEGKDISGTFNVAGDVGITLRDGLCGQGEQVSKLVPDPQDQQKILIEGDREIGQPVAEVVTRQQPGS